MEAHGSNLIYCDVRGCSESAKHYPHLDGWYCEEHANMTQEEILLWEDHYKVHRLLDEKTREHE